MADSLITYCYVQPACSAFSLHSCKNSHVCGANDHETVIHFASCTTAPPTTTTSFFASANLSSACV